MRRFKLTGPEVLVGGTNFSRLSNTILVRDGQLAVLADDDPRGDDLARSPYFQEVDENEAPIVHSPVVSESDDDTSENTSQVDETEKTRKKAKTSSDNGGV